MANPCALIGYFSVRILQYGPFPWRESMTSFAFTNEGLSKINRITAHLFLGLTPVVDYTKGP